MEIISLKDLVGGEGSASEGGPQGGKVCRGRADRGSPAGVHKISDLKAALRDENRVNVFVDGEYSFSLDLAQVVELGVKVGRELSPAELEKLKAESEFGKLYQRALEWTLMRPRSVREARDYLKRVALKRKSENKIRQANRAKSKEERAERHLKTKLLPEISEEQIELVLARLVQRGYLDDAKFAKFFIENRFARKGVSRRRLELELQNKGVSPDDVAAAFEDTPRDEETEILKIIAKKSRKYDAEKLIQYLTRQGFDYQLVRNLVAREMGLQSWE